MLYIPLLSLIKCLSPLDIKGTILSIPTILKQLISILCLFLCLCICFQVRYEAEYFMEPNKHGSDCFSDIKIATSTEYYIDDIDFITCRTTFHLVCTWTNLYVPGSNEKATIWTLSTFKIPSRDIFIQPSMFFLHESTAHQMIP